MRHALLSFSAFSFQFFVNNRNVGRYWPSVGPQVTLYVPKYFLAAPQTKIVMLELEQPGNCADSDKHECYVKFIDKPYYKRF